MCHSLGKHCLSGSRWTIQQHSPGRVNTNLSIKLMMCQWKLYSLFDFLLLDVIATNVLYSTLLTVRSATFN